MRLIQRQNYEKAAEIFEHLAQSGTPGVADRARVYLRFCGEKLRPRVRPLKSAEDYYVAGVSDLNSNRIDQGIEHLHRARKLDPRRGEIHYALAAGYSRRGDLGPAIAHLETSIQLDPQCRIQARHEEDFQALSRDPRFAALVSQARRTSAARA